MQEPKISSPRMWLLGPWMFMIIVLIVSFIAWIPLTNIYLRSLIVLLVAQIIIEVYMRVKP